MSTPEILLDVYLNLAGASQEQGKAQQRDKFLVLSAAIAEVGGYPQIAKDCRSQVLRHNPNHLLKSFDSVAIALCSEDFRSYLHQLERSYPFEKAEYLLTKFRAAGYSAEHSYPQLKTLFPLDATDESANFSEDDWFGSESSDEEPVESEPTAQEPATRKDLYVTGEKSRPRESTDRFIEKAQQVDPPSRLLEKTLFMRTNLTLSSTSYRLRMLLAFALGTFVGFVVASLVFYWTK